MIRLERVIDALPAGLEALRVEARANGHAMLDTLVTQWSSGAMRFARHGEMLLAAHVDNTLAGVGGLTQEPAIPGALRMRRFYIAFAYRRHGIGRDLAMTLLDAARQQGPTVVTCNAAVGSEAFWEALGFIPDERGGYTHILRR